MKGKSTKSALLMSFTSLLLCFAMLIGCTFAWFTDSVTSGVNTIQAGNLDIEVSYKNDNTNDWKNLEGSQTVFSQNRWEPGHTEFVTLKVENKGSLALKYRMNVSPINERGGINQAGNSFKLSDYLVFGTTEPVTSTTDPLPYTRATARSAVGETKGLNQNNLTKNTDMAPGETDYITLVVYMPETVGNDANYKTGTTAPEIELGIKFIATQLGSENEGDGVISYAENDSFGKDYDNNVYYQAIDTVVTYNYFPQTKQVAQLKNNGDVAVKGDDGDTHVDKSGNIISISSDAKVAAGTEQKPYATVSFSDGAVNFGGGDNATVTLKAEKTNEGTFEVGGTDVETVTYDVSVLSDKPWNGGTLFTVQLFIGAGKQGVSLTHKGDSDVPMKTVGDNGYVAGTADTFTYDSATGYVTMLVDHFSDFVAQYNAPVAAVGTTACYSLAQAAEMAKTANTKVDLIRDVKTEETVDNITLNLNGKKIDKLTVTGETTIQDTTGAVAGKITTLTISENAVVKAAGDTVTNTEGDGKDNIAYTDVKPEETEPSGDSGETPDTSKYCATDGDMFFTSLSAAFKLAKSGSKVTMLKDITSDSTLTVTGKNLTLDLNGKTLTASGDHDGIRLEDGANLTVKKGVYCFNTALDSKDAFYLVNKLTDTAKVTTLNLEKDVMVEMGRGNSAVHAYGKDGGKVIANIDATINANRPEGAGHFAAIQALYNAELNVTENAMITVVAPYSNFSQENDAIAIMAWGKNNVVNVTGGEFNISGKNAFVQAMQIGNYNGTNPTQFNVNGGIFNLSNVGGETYAFTAYYQNGGTFCVSDCTVNGTLTGFQTCMSGTTSISITGGTFSSDPSAYVADGKEAIENGDGTWTVGNPLPKAKIGTQEYQTLALAATAAKAGDTIEILRAGTYPYNELNAINDKAVTVKSTLSSNEAVVLERVTTGTDLARANGNGNLATFENLTIKFADSETKNGITHSPNGGAMVGNVKFKNCVISGFLYGYDDMTFTDCKFVLGANESKLNMTTYGANVTYTRCTFDGSVNVYWDSITADRKIVFDTCTFNKADKVNDANAAVFVKAAGFEAKSKKLEVEFIGEQTLNGYEDATYMNNDEIKWNGLRYISADGLWQVDDLENAYATVKVKGAEVFPFANLTSGSFILRDTDTAEITNSLIPAGYVAEKGNVAGNHNNGTPYYLYTVTAQTE